MCDIHQEGKLNPEQFMLAMWLISRKQAGKDPPAALTPDMVPPTMRPKGQDAVSRDCCPKFATGLKCLNRHRSKNICLTRLFFCQNDSLMVESLWQTLW